MRFNGAGPPAYVPRALRRGRAAGVILFKDNVASPADAQAARRDAPARRGRLGARRDRPGGRRDPQPSVGGAARASPPRPRRSAPAATPAPPRATCARPGVNVNLAPVADVGPRPARYARPRLPRRRAAGRGAYPPRPSRATAAPRSPPTAKHFPGLGAASENTDDAPVSLTRTPQQLLGEDLPPFRAAIAARVPLVMASHALYPRSTQTRSPPSPRTCCNAPAPAARLQGVVVTDSLEAKAVTARGGPAESAVRSVRAGADLCSPPAPAAICGAARAGRRGPALAAFRKRVEESAARVLALKRELGLRAPAT